MSKKLLILGNTVYTKEILEQIFTSGKYDIDVVSNKTSKNPVLQYTYQNNINTYSFDKLNDEAFEILRNNNYDLFIVIAYGKIIPQRFLDLPNLYAINIHGSLLPKYRGATPIQTALLNGDKSTGVSIQKMVYELDAGDIIKNYHIDIDINDNFETLREKMIVVVKEDILNLLDNIFNNKVEFTKQNNNEASFCKISDFSREKAKINWNNTSRDIHNKVRAFFPEPVAWTTINNKTLNILNTTITEIDSVNKPGTLFFLNKELYVSTSDLDLKINELVLEGKRKMSGLDFGNGFVKSPIQLQ